MGVHNNREVKSVECQHNQSKGSLFAQYNQVNDSQEDTQTQVVGFRPKKSQFNKHHDGMNDLPDEIISHANQALEEEFKVTSTNEQVQSQHNNWDKQTERAH